MWVGRHVFHLVVAGWRYEVDIAILERFVEQDLWEFYVLGLWVQIGQLRIA